MERTLTRRRDTPRILSKPGRFLQWFVTEVASQNGTNSLFVLEGEIGTTPMQSGCLNSGHPTFVVEWSDIWRFFTPYIRWDSDVWNLVNCSKHRITPSTIDRIRYTPSFNNISQLKSHVSLANDQKIGDIFADAKIHKTRRVLTLPIRKILKIV